MDNRTLHRWLATALGVPILYLSISGTLTTIAEIADPASTRRRAPGGQAGPEVPPLPVISTLAPGARTAVERLLRTMPPGDVSRIAIELRSTADGPRIQASANAQSVTVDALGQPARGAAPRQPQGRRLASILQDWHSGLEFGSVPQALVLISGLALAVLSITGILIWSQMWSRLRQAGRRALFWK